MGAMVIRVEVAGVLDRVGGFEKASEENKAGSLVVHTRNAVEARASVWKSARRPSQLMVLEVTP